MIIKDEIAKQSVTFYHLCKNHKVKYLYAFGSSTNDSFNFQTSDIDLLVEMNEIDPIERGE
jgi:predicted nucleotidyltransferase